MTQHHVPLKKGDRLVEQACRTVKRVRPRHIKKNMRQFFTL
jgi:hypothetical protein